MAKDVKSHKKGYRGTHNSGVCPDCKEKVVVNSSPHGPKIGKHDGPDGKSCPRSGDFFKSTEEVSYKAGSRGNRKAIRIANSS